MEVTEKTAKRTKKASVEIPKVIDEPKPVDAKQVDINQFITVLNGHHGTLVYESTRTGECFRWEEYGDEQELQIKDLRDAKNSVKKLFINNWFIFKKEDEWVLDYLGVKNFYKNAIGFGDFDNLFTKTPAELKKIISEMSEGQKNAVAHRAKQLVVDGEIDSRKVIAALEESLQVNFLAN